MTTSVTLLRELRDVPPGTHFPRSPQGTVPHFSKGRGRGARDSSDLESASLAVGHATRSWAKSQMLSSYSPVSSYSEGRMCAGPSGRVFR